MPLVGTAGAAAQTVASVRHEARLDSSGPNAPVCHRRVLALGQVLFENAVQAALRQLGLRKTNQPRRVLVDAMNRVKRRHRGALPLPPPCLANEIERRPAFLALVRHRRDAFRFFDDHEMAVLEHDAKARPLGPPPRIRLAHVPSHAFAARQAKCTIEHAFTIDSDLPRRAKLAHLPPTLFRKPPAQRRRQRHARRSEEVTG